MFDFIPAYVPRGPSEFHKNLLLDSLDFPHKPEYHTLGLALVYTEC